MRIRSTRNQGRGANGIAVAIIALVVVWIALRSPLGGFVQDSLVPIWKEGNQATIIVQDFFLLLKSKQALVNENKRLLNDVKQLEPQSLLVSVLKKENEELRFLLDRKENRSSILASVLARPNQTPYDTIIIDIGSNQGIAIGDVAIALGDFPIGKISRVNKKTALVELYSSSGIETSMVLEGIERIPIVAKGRGAGNFIATIPREIVVAKGNVIVIPGSLGGPLSVVESIVTSPAEPFQTIFFRNPINLTSLGFVEVISYAGTEIF